MMAQSPPRIRVDVICGPTCIHAPKVYRITQAEIRRITRKMDLQPDAIQLYKWTLPETVQPTADNVLLNDKHLTSGDTFPELLAGYGSPTVLINTVNITNIPASALGYASCAGFIPHRLLIRKKLEEWLGGGRR